MPNILSTDITTILAALFGIAVLFLAIISLITFAVFFKNAEKRSVATGIAITYTILFVVILIIAFTTFTTLT